MKSVLIVEDNQAMLRGLEDNFAMKGYRVKTAPDGERGLHAALAGRPDLVILDIMLPKLNDPSAEAGYAYHHAHGQGSRGRRDPRTERRGG
ncbi:MAG: response regulator [Sedimentisphaerales bacterium]